MAGRSLAILAAAGVVIYANSFQVPFVFDGTGILSSFRAREIWPWQLKFGQNRPLGFLSFSLNYVVSKEDVWGYHAVNVAIHVLAGWSLYGIVRRTLAQRPLTDHYAAVAQPLALAAAAIWLVHPLQTESVTYLYQRLESLMGLFYLLTLYCFIRAIDSPKPGAWYAASVMACALGMGTKEVAVAAPLVVLWYDRALVASSWREIAHLRWKYYAALAATWGILGYLIALSAHLYEKSGLLYIEGVTPLDYAASEPGVILHYLRLCFWPSHLCLDYGWPVARHAADIVPAALVITALLAATVWCVFRRPALGFLGGCFFLILAPTSSVAPIADLAFEHRMYLPLAAVAVLAVVAAYRAWVVLMGPLDPIRLRQGRVPRPLLASATAFMVVGGLGWRTFARNEDYHSEVSIWQHTAREAPRNSRAVRGLAEKLCENRQAEQALAELNQGIQRMPDDPAIFNARGIVHEQLEHWNESLADMGEAIRLNADFGNAYFNRAGVYFKLSRYAEAAADLTKTIALESATGVSKKTAASTYQRRATAYEALSLDDRATADYTKAIELNSADPANYLHRGRAYDRLEKYAQARDDFDAALRLEPTNLSVLNDRGWLLSTCPDSKVRDGPQALADAAAACKLTGWQNPQNLDTLAAAYAERGDFPAAVKWETKAIAMASGYEDFSRDARRRLEQYRAGKPFRQAVGPRLHPTTSQAKPAARAARNGRER